MTTVVILTFLLFVCLSFLPPPPPLTVTAERINETVNMEFGVGNESYCKCAWPEWSNHLIKTSFVKIKLRTIMLSETAFNETSHCICCFRHANSSMGLNFDAES